MKRIISFVMIMAMLLAFTGCSAEKSGSQEQKPTEEVKMTPTQACAYLDKIYIAGTVNVPAPSCGLVLPKDIPMEYVEMQATGTLKENNETVDLLEGKDIKPDEWIVFEDLQQCSEAECTVRITWEGKVFEEKTFDLLKGSEKGQE